MTIDPNSALWDAVRKHALHEIERARDRLEQAGFEETEFERGRIKALRDVLALAVPAPTIT